MVADGASDLILKVGSLPILRLFGSLVTLDDEQIVDAIKMQSFVNEILTKEQIEEFDKYLELDLSYEIKGLSRFRINILRQRGSIAIVARRIPKNIPLVQELNVPEAVLDFALRPRGLVLVTGPAGCGKSTTLASLIDYRNSKEACHIITVEDPVEFLYEDKVATVNQRQIGRDTNSFAAALKHVLRQDPDVIVIGDMRDLETIAMAITAAETGHLVFANLHTTNAVSTIDRIIDVFPSYQQQQIRMQVSVNLVGVISQLLVNKDPGPGRVAAYEVMVANAAVRNMIRESKTFQLHQLLQTQSRNGMKTMNQSLTELINNKVISHEAALSISSDPKELQNIGSISSY